MMAAFRCSVVGLGMFPLAAYGNIGVELRPAHGVVLTGESIRIEMYVVADSGAPQSLSGAQVILGWEPTYLHLAGIDSAGAASLLYSGFPLPDPFGLNESSPPGDGLGMFVAFANLGAPVVATESGTLLTTLVFDALAETGATEVELVPMAGTPEGRTTVFDGMAPNRDVTGALRGAAVTVIASPSAALGLVLCVAPAIRRRRHEWHGKGSAVRVGAAAGRQRGGAGGFRLLRA